MGREGDSVTNAICCRDLQLRSLKQGYVNDRLYSEPSAARAWQNALFRRQEMSYITSNCCKLQMIKSNYAMPLNTRGYRCVVLYSVM